MKRSADKLPVFLGTRLKDKRDQFGLSLDELAGKIGCSKSYLWELEKRPQTDAINPSGGFVFHLSRIFGVRMEYFYDVEDSQTFSAEIGARVMQAVYQHLDFDKVAKALGYEKVEEQQ